VSSLEFSPATGSVVGNDCIEHGSQSRRVQGFPVTDRDGACGLVVVAGGDDSVGTGHDAAVIEKEVDVILGRQNCTDVAMQDEIRLGSALDGLGYLWIDGMDEIAHLLADPSLPGREAIDVSIDSGIGVVRARVRSRALELTAARSSSTRGPLRGILQKPRAAMLLTSEDQRSHRIHDELNRNGREK
jgi:hypothetical protein